jgi:hypothetical protein
MSAKLRNCAARALFAPAPVPLMLMLHRYMYKWVGGVLYSAALWEMSFAKGIYWKSGCRGAL